MIKVGTLIAMFDVGSNQSLYGIILASDESIPAYKIRMFRIAIDPFEMRKYLKHAEWWINAEDVICTGEKICSR